MAVQVAEPGTVIVSCDSIAVYQGLDVAAAKPSEAQRGGLRHEMLSVVSATEAFTAVRYRELARAVIDASPRPMLVGGSGLYFRAVVDDLGFQPSDPVVRAELAGRDPSELLVWIRERDPATAARLDPRNVRRLVRAAEIITITGGPIAVDAWQRFEGPYELRAAFLTWRRADLYRRIDERIERQLAGGLVEEIASLKIGPTAQQGVGVKEVLAHLAGEVGFDEMRERLRRNSRRLARRQESWFKADPRVVRVDASELGWEGAAQRIRAVFAQALPQSER